MIKYIGSKRLLTTRITELVRDLAGPRGSVLDLFSGTSRVGHALKRAGYQVFANDHNAYAATLARCYVQADASDVEAARDAIEELNALPGEAGYFTRTFCEESRFFQAKNGRRIDAMRDLIATLSDTPEVEAVLLVALMEAADRVDSTTGVQMAYLKSWAPRAHHDIKLRMPEVLARAASGKGRAHQLDALEAATQLSGDVAYLDPPYNQHKYLGNYHIWETLVRWDAPDAYGIARKRVDCKERRSAFNSKPGIRDALRAILDRLDVEHIILSFNNEGFLALHEIRDLLATRGDVVVVERDYKRYVGAKIGIHAPSGEKVGAVSHVDNKEYLFVVSTQREALDRVRARGDIESQGIA